MDDYTDGAALPQDGFDDTFSIKKEPEIIQGRVLKNGKRITYDISIFGEWVRYWREDQKHLTLDEVAEIYNDKVLFKRTPTHRRLTGANWRTAIELLEKPSQATPGAHARTRPVSREHCWIVSETLDIPLADVEMRAGFIPRDGSSNTEWDTMGFLIRSVSETDYQTILAVIRKFRENQKRQQ